MTVSPFPLPHTPRWPSPLARAGLWIIAAGVLLSAVSGPLNRFGVTDLQTALAVLAAGFLLTAIGTAIAIIGLLAAIAKRCPIPSSATPVGIVVGLALTGYLLSWVRRGLTTPPIHDITTDPADPPAFVAVIGLRARANAINAPEYVRQMRGPGGRMIDVPRLQQKYYPDVRPLQLALPPAQALNKALRVAREFQWRIDAESPAEGRLEATAETTFFGFKDDVVVRIRPSGTGSRIDVTSESRVGLGDVGTNAARIRAFLKRMAQRHGSS